MFTNLLPQFWPQGDWRWGSYLVIWALVIVFLYRKEIGDWMSKSRRSKHSDLTLEERINRAEWDWNRFKKAESTQTIVREMEMISRGDDGPKRVGYYGRAQSKEIQK